MFALKSLGAKMCFLEPADRLEEATFCRVRLQIIVGQRIVGVQSAYIRRTSTSIPSDYNIVTILYTQFIHCIIWQCICTVYTVYCITLYSHVFFSSSITRSKGGLDYCRPKKGLLCVLLTNVRFF